LPNPYRVQVQERQRVGYSRQHGQGRRGEPAPGGAARRMLVSLTRQ
jgi:hypothetical protein